MCGNQASSQDLDTVTGQKSVSGSPGSTRWFKLNQRSQGPNCCECEECVCVIERETQNRNHCPPTILVPLKKHILDFISPSGVFLFRVLSHSEFIHHTVLSGFLFIQGSLHMPLESQSVSQLFFLPFVLFLCQNLSVRLT